jgi:hypothetical protein
VKSFLNRARPTVLGLAVIAVLSLAGTAFANRSIRDNTINTRDIKDNQVNSRDIRDNSITTRDIRDNQVNTSDVRDGAIRGIDVHDGSIGIADLSSEVVSLAATATLVDPRAQQQSGYASWAKGPVALTDLAASAADPLPSPSSGQAWRDIVLEPGTYLVLGSAAAGEGASAAEGVATRLFLDGKPLADGTGYTMVPVSTTALATPTTSTTVVSVPPGDASARHLIERVAAVGGVAKLSDDLAVVALTPR